MFLRLISTVTVFTVLCISASPSNAIPVTYSLNGVLTKGAVVGTYPILLDATLDQSIFGPWSGTLTYDVDTATFDSDITLATGEIAGAIYNGGVTDIDIVLNNGENLAATTGRIVIYNGDSSLLPIGYGTQTSFTIPDTFWQSNTAPKQLIPVLSFITFGVAGLDPNRNELSLPPLNLNGAGTVVQGQICGNETGSVFAPDQSDCFDISGGGSAVSVVPIPSAIWLFGTALVGIVGFRARRKSS